MRHLVNSGNFCTGIYPELIYGLISWKNIGLRYMKILGLRMK